MLGLQDWACEDFDLFDFIGQDDAATGYYDADHPHPTGADENLSSRFDDVDAKDNAGSLEKRDSMYTLLQYNELAASNSMYSQRSGASANASGMMSEEMSGGSFMTDDRYNNSGLLDSAVSKLHLQHQQIQPSTSRLPAAAAHSVAPPTYANAQQQQPQGRMRPSPQQQQHQHAATHHHAPPNGGDLAESVLLPTSSMSPLGNGVNTSSNNNMYMAPIKTEPVSNYEMHTNDQYFDSTSDAESHYSHGGTANGGGPMTTTRPRKYRIKPESERLNPQYRLKRAKNNDAVRRSREKAKQQQIDKEKRLARLETEHEERIKLVASLQKRNAELEKELVRVRAACRCGATAPAYRR